MGALHIHMLLWVDNSVSKEGKVSAIVPREVGDRIWENPPYGKIEFDA